MSVRELMVDPITRIEGHLGARLLVNVHTRRPNHGSVRVFATAFRGFEVFGLGRPPEDMPAMTSRFCGVCGSSHANASMHAVDMAYGVSPEPLGVALRNLGFGMDEYLYDHTIILNLLEGPDYSEVMVKKFTPSVWSEAERTLAENRGRHGFEKISDIMRAFNPVTGRMWQLAVHFQRIAREAGVLIYGKHPHPNALIPGGIQTNIYDIEETLIAITYRLVKLTAWVKFNYYVWEDLLNFYKNIGYEMVGLTYQRPRLMSVGLFDDPEKYSQIGNYVSWEEFYKSIDAAAEARDFKPGLVLEGEMVSTKYTDMNVSTMEHVDMSFYDEWKDKVRKEEWYTEVDPFGSKLLWGNEDPAYHPWNKVTLPKPKRLDWNDKYTWVARVNIVWKDGTIGPIEVGPFARVYVQSRRSATTAGGLMKSGNGKVEVTLPRAVASELPPTVWEEATIEWNVPESSTTIYRLWGRAFCLVMVAASMWGNVLKTMEILRQGERKSSRPWKVPRGITRGAGFVEAPRGAVRHWIVQRGGRTLNYQAHAPTTANASARDEKRVTDKERYAPGPFEAAVSNVVITEELPPEKWEGLDVVRAIRSFDPCLACAVHIEFGEGDKIIKTVKKIVTEIPTTL
ncbi:MAG: nickel-dependent hydrogenase large subunit [Acidilobaceae archaeon]|nr:nickel-dependent hydrogenase large subunit [Acidilobaceae archaeon]